MRNRHINKRTPTPFIATHVRLHTHPYTRTSILTTISIPNMAPSTPIKKNGRPLKAGATGTSSNPRTLQRAKALRGISGPEAELVRARSNLRTQISQQKQKAKRTDEYAQLPDDKKESWLADFIEAKTPRAVARVAEAEKDVEVERAHLKTIQEEEKAAAQLTMTFEELMEDLGEKVDSVCGSMDGISSDDETASNGLSRSLDAGSGAEDDRDGEHVALSKKAVSQREHFLWLYQWILQVSRPGYLEAERYFNERDARVAAAKAKATSAGGSLTGPSDAKTEEATGTGEGMKSGEGTKSGEMTKTVNKRKLSSAAATPRKKRAPGVIGQEAEGRPMPAEKKKTKVR